MSSGSSGSSVAVPEPSFFSMFCLMSRILPGVRYQGSVFLSGNGDACPEEVEKLKRGQGGVTAASLMWGRGIRARTALMMSRR